jgi:hypothetical protein
MNECCIRILSLTELLDLSIVLLDLDRHLRDLSEHRTKRRASPGGMTARLRLAKHRVEETGIRWPQDFVNPRTVFTAAVRSRTMRSRARIKVDGICKGASTFFQRVHWKPHYPALKISLALQYSCLYDLASSHCSF